MVSMNSMNNNMSNMNSEKDERKLDELQSLIAPASMASPIRTYDATATVNIIATPSSAFSNLQIELLPDTQANNNSNNSIDLEEGGLWQHPGLQSSSYKEECHNYDHDGHDHNEHEHQQGTDSYSSISSPASVVPSFSYYANSSPKVHQHQHQHQHQQQHRISRSSNSNSKSIEAEPSPSISLVRCRHEYNDINNCNGNDNDNQYLPGRETPKAKSKSKHRSTRDQCTQTMTLGTRIQMERSTLYHYFSLREDFDSTILHIQSTFVPSVLFPHSHSHIKCNHKCLRRLRQCFPLPLVFRILWCYWTFGILITDHRDAMHHRKMCNIMYFGHLTNITLILTLCYQCLSTFLSFWGLFWRRHSWFLPLFHVHSPKKGNANYANDVNDADTDVACTPGIIVTMTWFIYSIALPAEFIVAIGFWTFEYDPDGPPTFITIYQHAIIGFLLLFDGNVIGRIPLRLKHCKGLLVYGITYLLWSMGFSYLQLGKRHGVIYDFMDWRKDPGLAAAIGFLLLFVIGPVVFLVCWWVSVSDGGCCFGLLGLCGYGGGRRRVVSVLEYHVNADAQGEMVKEEQEQEWVGRNIDLNSIRNDVTCVCAADGKDLESDRRNCHDLNKGWNGWSTRYASLDSQETDTTLSTETNIEYCIERARS